MAHDIVIPALGESIQEATIARWLKNVGDPVTADEPVAELETDKVTVELRAPAAGVLTEQQFEVGATVHIGDVVGRVDVPGAAATEAPPRTVASTERPPETPVPVATTGEPPAEPPKPPAETPKPPAETPKPPAETPEPPAEIPKPLAETPKPPAETPKPPAETPKPLAETPKPPTETPKPLAAAPPPVAATPPPVAATPPPVATTREPVATNRDPGAESPGAASLLANRPLPPSVRRALREHGGDGEGRPSPSPPAPIPAPAVAAQTPSRVPSPPAATGAREEVIPMSPLRRRIAEHLVQAQHAAAALTTFNEIDMSAVMSLRDRFKDSFLQKHGIKLGFMSFFTRATALALQEFPGLNAEVRDSAIAYKHHYDIGIAVGSGKGLVVPVVRDADTLSFAEIELAIAALAARAKDNKLTLDELTGGTFTITNGGIYGSMMSTPLLNFPQTGILGMHNIIRRPIAIGAIGAIGAVGAAGSERIEVRPMMYVAVTYDHRVVDGREAVQFLIAIKSRLEAPERMLLSV